VFRRHNQILLTLLILLDLALILGSWNLAYWLRFRAINFPPAQVLYLSSESIAQAEAQGLPSEAAARLVRQVADAYTTELGLRRAVERVLRRDGLERFTATVMERAIGRPSTPPFGPYANVTPVLLAITALLFYALGVYRSQRFASVRRELQAVLQGCVLVVFAMMAASFFYRDFEYSRMHMVYFGVCMGALVTLERLAVRNVLRMLRARGLLLRRFVLVGDSALAARFYQRWMRHQDSGFQLVGLVTPGAAVETPALRGLPHLGRVDQLREILDRHPAEQVISALTMRQYEAAEQVTRVLADHFVDLRIVPDLGPALPLHTEAENFDGLPMIAVSQGPLQGWNQVFKRVLDLTGSVAALIVFSPVFLVAPLLIKFTSPGPVFYVQERMGWNGKTFRMLKFRTMRSDAEQQSGPVWAKEGDTRTTPLGRHLRRTSLDEIPQFLNVLRGDMSLVGPRPERPVFIQSFRKEIPYYMARHKVKAGITGWAQVNGWRGNTSLEKRIEFDLFYISNWSIGFDFRILFMTVFKGFFHRNAY
jgi:exopolysaccharide biosynthesis polyprenyl glycosylphosphotransferase